MSSTRQTGLQSLLEGVQNAVIGAQTLMQEQHTNELKKLLDDDGKPLHQTVQMPHIDPKTGELAYRDVHVPLMAITPPAALKIARLKVNFEARLHGTGKAGKCEDGCDHEMKLSLGGFFNRGTKVQCEIEFEGTEPPEGWMLINDEVVKVIK
jgi:hypothetical protein